MQSRHWAILCKLLPGRSEELPLLAAAAPASRENEACNADAAAAAAAAVDESVAPVSTNSIVLIVTF